MSGVVKGSELFALAGVNRCPLISPGYYWLMSISSAYEEARDDLHESDNHEDLLMEMADTLMPDYLWAIFTDLSAWREQDTVDDYVGCNHTSMEEQAKIALYVIAERLLFALYERDLTGQS